METIRKFRRSTNRSYYELGGSTRVSLYDLAQAIERSEVEIIEARTGKDLVKHVCLEILKEREASYCKDPNWNELNTIIRAGGFSAYLSKLENRTTLN